MSKTVSKFALAASLVLAMAFVFSCSPDNDNLLCLSCDEGGSSSSYGGGDNPSSSSVGGGQGDVSSSSGGGGDNPSSSSVGDGDSSSSDGGQGDVSSSSGGDDDNSSSSSVDGESSSSSSSSSVPSSSSLARSDKGNNISNYRTVVIGAQTWMAENLDYTVEGSKCYADDPTMCDKYGQLYDWATAMNLPSSCNSNSCSSQIQSKHRGICPEGWHIPNGDDWNDLINQVGGSSTAGKHLKAQSGWPPSRDIENLDTYGFSALPGGYGNGGSFDLGDGGGKWWSASEYEDYSRMAYLQLMYYATDNAYNSGDGFKNNHLSVRCVKDSGISPSSSSVAYSGKGNNISNYRTVVIGTQTWMAENLDYVVEGSKCYNNDPARCNEYGSLYNWSTAMALPSSCNSSTCSSQIQSKHRGICPEGWHIPSYAEWEVLFTFAGGYSAAGTKLKAASGWNSNGNGTNDYGFSALPGGGGFGYSGGSFDYVGDYGNWWKATEGALTMIYHSSDVYRNDDNKSMYSLRCVQD